MLSLLAVIHVSEVLGLTLTPLLWREIIGGVAVVITLIGVRLCWQSTHYRMSIEESAKDGLLTSEQARRRIAFMHWAGPGVTVAGCTLLAVVVWY